FCLAMQPRFNIPHGCRAVAVLVAEIPLPVHEQVAHAPFLGHSDHGVEDGGISMRMVFPHHLPYDTGGFFMRFVAVIPQFVHPMQDATMYWFQSVPYIREGPAYDHRHRIID